MAVRPAFQQQHTQSAMLPSQSTCEYPDKKAVLRLVQVASLRLLLLPSAARLALLTKR